MGSTGDDGNPFGSCRISGLSDREMASSVRMASTRVPVMSNASTSDKQDCNGGDGGIREDTDEEKCCDEMASCPKCGHSFKFKAS